MELFLLSGVWLCLVGCRTCLGALPLSWGAGGALRDRPVPLMEDPG